MRAQWVRCSVLGVALLFFAGCGDDGVIGTGININGAAQKGPFVQGSQVLVNTLSDQGEATGSTIVTSTLDPLGRFEFHLDEPRLVQITAEGYHFNELTGTLSEGTLLLRAIADTRNGSAYVNILTHLIYNRVKKLLGEGKAPAEAIAQAQTELIGSLSSIFKSDNATDFTKLAVYNFEGTTAEGNAYLLAVSATAYKYAMLLAVTKKTSTDAALTQLLNTLAEDFADGNIDDFTVEGLRGASELLDPAAVQTHLLQLGEQVDDTPIDVPDISGVVSTMPAPFDHSTVVDTCISCHDGVAAAGKSANHISSTNECGSCHLTSAWLPVTVDHNAVLGTCSSCHNGMIAKGKTPNHIVTTQECDVCHGVTTWTLSSFEHSTITTEVCSDCHDGVNATGKPPTHIATTEECGVCHSVTQWVP